MKDSYKKVPCPKCKGLVRKRMIRETKLGVMCVPCWRKEHRKELKAEMRIEQGYKPIVRVSSKKINNKNILDSALGIRDVSKEESKEKTLSRMRRPIKQYEKKLLVIELKKEGLSYDEIDKRIKNLEENCLMNHEKALRNRLKGGQ